MSKCTVRLLLLALANLSTLKIVASETNKSRSPLWNATYVDLLKRDLLQSYDKFARPSQHFNTTTVLMDLLLTHVHIDDAKFLMDITAYVRLEWEDNKLKWNEKNYGGLKQVHMADHEVWQPDVTIYNSAVGSLMEHYGNSHCIVYSSGRVLWVPPAHLQVYCDLNLKKWPYDTHSCKMIFGSWTYSGEQIDLTITNDTVVHDHSQGFGNEWIVVEATLKRIEKDYDSAGIYPVVIAKITVGRNGSTYLAVLFIPCLGLVMMTLSVFWLPSTAQERLVLPAITALLLSMFLIFMAMRIPVFGSRTPLIVIFFSVHLLMVVISIMIFVFTFNVSRSKRPVPWFIQHVIKGPLGYYFGVQVSKKGYEEESGGEEEMRGYDEARGDQGMILVDRPHPAQVKMWAALGTVLNRILFVVYVFVFALLALMAVF